MVGINNLYINKIPNSCKECPLTYLDTGDDAYFGSYERICVIDNSCVDGIVSERAYDCPLVEAIPKADYENRLKADMVAILEEIKTGIDYKFHDDGGYYADKDEVDVYIQEKIDKLKVESENT